MISGCISVQQPCPRFSTSWRGGGSVQLFEIDAEGLGEK